MKIALFGATGKTGLEILKQALKNEHSVRAFVRDPERLNLSHENLSFIQGDIHNTETINTVIQDQDAVIVALGTGQSLGKSTVRSTGTENIIKAMNDQNVKRLIVITAMGIGESWKNLSLINRLFFATLLKNSRIDHEAQEKHIKSSNLEWTIIRPSGLTDEAGTGGYMSGENIRSKTSRIPRADVADLILKSLEQKSFIKKAITITN